MTDEKKADRADRPAPAEPSAVSPATGRRNVVAALVILLVSAGVFGYPLLRGGGDTTPTDSAAAFTPTESNQDPSIRIPGVTVVNYGGGQHVGPQDQVAYTRSPPMGGNHDSDWAACNGVVYDRPVRSETLVHSMEHGAAWIAYNPDQVSGERLRLLTRRVQGVPYSALTPYPGLDQPISLQTWGRQLKLGDAADPRIDQFLAALRRNRYTHPEFGASCQALGAGKFDQDQPPPYRPAPPISSVGQPGVAAEVAPPAVPG